MPFPAVCGIRIKRRNFKLNLRKNLPLKVPQLWQSWFSGSRRSESLITEKTSQTNLRALATTRTVAPSTVLAGGRGVTENTTPRKPASLQQQDACSAATQRRRIFPVERYCVRQRVTSFSRFWVSQKLSEILLNENY